jgi:CDP-6-deoxy-D-xylo-4-hexulose-3-dehydrase
MVLMRVPASGSIITAADKAAMHAVIDAGWLTAGAVNAGFEQGLAAFTGIPHVRTCNSGSSANLLAVAAMVAAGRWSPGDEIVTVAAGFPTTVNPLLLYGLVPVFVDVDPQTYNAIPEQVERAISHRTKGIMLAHTLGNPFHASILGRLPTVEDCCDALGSTAAGAHVGSQSDLATCSFFPAHHITTGEGGAVMTKHAELARVIESLRDWGRDCWCSPGANNTCGKRFLQQHGELPQGYDHKYTFTNLGYNLKITEVGAACGVTQLERLPEFVRKRVANFAFLERRLQPFADKLVLPKATPGSQPSWFGFPITLKEEGMRAPMQQYLAQNGVDSRLLFAGNVTKQPYMAGRKFRVAAELRNTDKIMNDSFWIGLHPALTEEDLDYAGAMIGNFIGEFA